MLGPVGGVSRMPKNIRENPRKSENEKNLAKRVGFWQMYCVLFALLPPRALILNPPPQMKDQKPGGPRPLGLTFQAKTNGSL